MLGRQSRVAINYRGGYPKGMGDYLPSIDLALGPKIVSTLRPYRWSFQMNTRPTVVQTRPKLETLEANPTQTLSVTLSLRLGISCVSSKSQN